jgi:hypothetical protein
VKAAPAKTTPRATNDPKNDAMLAAIVPLVPYCLSKTTHNAITLQKARRMTKTAAVRKYLFKAHSTSSSGDTPSHPLRKELTPRYTDMLNVRQR